MTPLEHNKYVGIANLAYGVIHVLIMIVTMVFFFGMMGIMARDRGGVPPLAFFGVIMAFVVGVNLIMSIPSFVAGYAFLKRKRWAKIAGIVAAVASAMHAPFGTAVCVYTFWFLFSEPGKALYEKASQTLPPPPPDWVDVDRQKGREREFVPGASPPDWR
jgi:hypothetical protein